MYYDINTTLSHNALFNFVCGDRGMGKTFAWKRYALNRFLKHGEQFIYMRRYDTELRTCRKFWDDLLEFYPAYELSYDKGCFLVDGQIAGYTACLSKQKSYKSTPFPNVYTIIFDEFLIDKGTIRYLNNEVTEFLEAYNTIDRPVTRAELGKKDAIVGFLANAISMMNPYFLYWELREPRNGKDFFKCKSGEVLLHMPVNCDFREAAKKTRFGKIIAGSEYESYAVESRFLRDNSDTFIGKLDGDCTYFCTIKYLGESYGVWRGTKADTFWIGCKVDNNCKRIYAFTLEDHSVNTEISKNFKHDVRLQSVYDAFVKARVMFEDKRVQAQFMNAFRKVL